MASRSLDDLTPSCRAKADRFLALCAAAGIDVLVYCTLRGNEEQDALYAVGRTVKGRNVRPSKPMGDIVTNARAGQSLHNDYLDTKKSRAFDCVPLLNGKAQWDDAVLYRKMGDIGAKCGLAWAGLWQGNLKEQAHFQDGK